MGTVTGLTAARMQAIENASVIGGSVVGDNLILTKKDTTTVNAGNVRGATGAAGPASSLYVAMPKHFDPANLTATSNIER